MGSQRVSQDLADKQVTTYICLEATAPAYGTSLSRSEFQILGGLPQTRLPPVTWLLQVWSEGSLIVRADPLALPRSAESEPA